jgi:hypothetical protein
MQLQLDQSRLCQVLNDRSVDIQNQLALVDSHTSELLLDSKVKDREQTLAWLASVSFTSDHKIFQQKWVPDTTSWFFKNQSFGDWSESLHQVFSLLPAKRAAARPC